MGAVTRCSFAQSTERQLCLRLADGMGYFL
jgi:hypothetical protein